MWAPYQHDGFLAEIIVAHYIAIPTFIPAITSGEIAAYALPQGFLALNYDAAAMKQPGYLSKIGLGTAVDPRYGYCGFTKGDKRTFAEPVTVDGEEYLFYRTLVPKVCVLRGTTCDPRGNITMEKEAGIMDPLSMAMAAHNNGGLVIVQVERFSDKPANPHDVQIPGYLVDVVYDDPDQEMMNGQQYNDIYAGQSRVAKEDIPALIDELIEINASKRKNADIMIANRAVLDVNPEYEILNLGVGIPMLLAYSVLKKNPDISITLECGVGGGIPVGYTFGIVNNADIFVHQADMFRLYEGGGIDLTCVGAMEIDKKGNINCFRKGDKLIGLGGFNHVTGGAKHILVCSRFMVGSDVNVVDGELVFTDGKESKFCEEVEYLNLNAKLMMEQGKILTYITERCVLQMTPDGLELTEIAPTLDLEKDILAKMPFRPLISKDLKVIPAECYPGYVKS